MENMVNNSENAIVIKDLCKKFGDVTAVKQLSLTVKHGEFFSLLGENGAGKTTTVKMLCNLLTPTSGEMEMLGKNAVKERDGIDKFINLSPQETAVAANLSVKENLEMTAELYGENKETSRKRADEIIEELHLEEVKNKRAKTLSGGMQRRLSIGMALITSPEILFLDEPTLGLDVRARRELWKLISSLKGKTTVILTTHYLEEAEALSDRIAVMSRGELKAVGTYEELKTLTGKDNIDDVFLTLTGDEI